VAKEIIEEEAISITRACRIIELDRSMFYYVSVKDDSELEQKLNELSQTKFLCNRGCPEYVKRIRRDWQIINHKRIERVYKKMKMTKRRKIKRRLKNPERQPLTQPIVANMTWSMDFMEDRLENGRKVRTLNIIDDCNREPLTIEIQHSFPSKSVVEIVERVIEMRGKPENIRTDNGTEFIAKAFEGFCKNSSINHIRIQKGKPNQNAYIERFNRSYREDVLDSYIFETLDQVRELTEEWMHDYINNHQHSALGMKTPKEFLIGRI
jgi:putative transposase